MVKFLIIVFCTFILLRLLFRPILRFIVQSVVNKMVNNNSGTTNRQESKKYKKHGNIDVDFVPPQKKYAPSPKAGTGDYIDYEEIK